MAKLSNAVAGTVLVLLVANCGARQFNSKRNGPADDDVLLKLDLTGFPADPLCSAPITRLFIVSEENRSANCTPDPVQGGCWVPIGEQREYTESLGFHEQVRDVLGPRAIQVTVTYRNSQDVKCTSDRSWYFSVDKSMQFGTVGVVTKALDYADSAAAPLKQAMRMPTATLEPPLAEICRDVTHRSCQKITRCVRYFAWWCIARRTFWVCQDTVSTECSCGPAPLTGHYDPGSCG